MKHWSQLSTDVKRKKKTNKNWRADWLIEYVYCASLCSSTHTGTGRTSLPVRLVSDSGSTKCVLFSHAFRSFLWKRLSLLSIFQEKKINVPVNNIFLFFVFKICVFYVCEQHSFLVERQFPPKQMPSIFRYA